MSADSSRHEVPGVANEQDQDHMSRQLIMQFMPGVSGSSASAAQSVGFGPYFGVFVGGKNGNAYGGQI